MDPLVRNEGGVRFRDLNRNGVMDPFEDPRLDVETRVADLLPRLSIDELIGLMFHTVIECGESGEVMTGPGAISKSGTPEVVVERRMNHFNVHALRSARETARWSNRVQLLATQTEHAIPVTISSDPRHGAAQNAGTSWHSAFLSQWPDPLGIAALGDPEVAYAWADTVRREYCAIGIRQALHPTADLATEPRWARQRETFGQDPGRVTELLSAALRGLQGERLDAESVAATVKHFPGGGPQAGGEDAHFPYGREQVYPGGRFADHLRPFEAAIDLGAAVMMPYYGMPVGLEVDGSPVPEVGFGFNRAIVTDLLRRRLGYDGVVLSDWELISDNHVGDQVLPARAWGVEHLDRRGRMLALLDAGVDQFGGEECTELLAELVAEGAVSRARLEESARRILKVKFALGLFDNPFVDEDEAEKIAGSEDAVRLGEHVQARSVTLLKNSGIMPLGGARVYAEGIEDLGGLERVADPSHADVALIRLPAPWEARDDLFLEEAFHQGSLNFPPGLIHRLSRIPCPLIIDVMADRPAICTPLVDLAAGFTVSFGVSDRAWLKAVTGEIPPEGTLPIQFPSSMESVRRSREDVPGDCADALFEAGDGLLMEGSQ